MFLLKWTGQKGQKVGGGRYPIKNNLFWADADLELPLILISHYHLAVNWWEHGARHQEAPFSCAPHWKGRICSVPSDCQNLSASHSSWWEGWLRKWQKTAMTKKCCLFSASNKAFPGEQKWSELLMRYRLPKKTHGQIRIFQVAGGRNVTVHWSLQHSLFFALTHKIADLSWGCFSVMLAVLSHWPCKSVACHKI